MLLGIWCPLDNLCARSHPIHTPEPSQITTLVTPCWKTDRCGAQCQCERWIGLIPILDKPIVVETAVAEKVRKRKLHGANVPLYLGQCRRGATLWVGQPSGRPHGCAKCHRIPVATVHAPVVGSRSSASTVSECIFRADWDVDERTSDTNQVSCLALDGVCCAPRAVRATANKAAAK